MVLTPKFCTLAVKFSTGARKKGSKTIVMKLSLVLIINFVSDLLKIAEPKLGARYSPLRQVVMQDKRNMGVLMVRRNEAVSPHTLMGMNIHILSYTY